MGNSYQTLSTLTLNQPNCTLNSSATTIAAQTASTRREEAAGGMAAQAAATNYSRMAASSAPKSWIVLPLPLKHRGKDY